MPLLPSRTKYRKWHRGRIRGNATRCNKIDFGDFGIQSLERGLLTAAQIEAARVALTRHMKRRGKVWIRIFPQKPITKKPLETRMGKGKGNVEAWTAVIKPGTVLFEISGVSAAAAKEALSLADSKLPLHCRFIERENSIL